MSNTVIAMYTKKDKENLKITLLAIVNLLEKGEKEILLTNVPIHNQTIVMDEEKVEFPGFIMPKYSISQKGEFLKTWKSFVGLHFEVILD